ncbi:50S ribosomal protein L19 [Sulfurihydrogenibium azorense]|uniref:Large ribosomal subunit protein bL19 n=1 Tax=Sulfurihydrogenibium azorense (strain DSM 15241 / OCM 825 / Az-Fu1) TaxID=204536 RepID=C1DXR4_SULAA|nr:50S ribosomal protein L19 [Sulfurihydrogenibium azorense]ACN98898.1 ribosomal protein L19 [Sulfurihydrogenibium azorense Az-Fu1]MDM7273442.1 50S ribosomal protein L19 [Sulfurihydrogenibium azorense]
MHQLIREIEERYLPKDIPQFRPGDTVRVHLKVKEGEKERTQIFEGLVIRVRGSGLGKTFTVRKVSYGVGMERIFPIACPSIQKIEIVKRGIVRRAKLYYIRNLKGKSARIRELKEWEIKKRSQESQAAKENNG